MDSISRLPLKIKLLLITVPPLLALLVFAGARVVDAVGNIRHQDQLVVLVALNGHVAGLAQQIAEERGRSVAYLAKRSPDRDQAMSAQRRLVDGAASTFQAEVTAYRQRWNDPALDQDLAGVLNRLRELNGLRVSVSRAAMGSEEVLQRYSRITDALLAVSPRIAARAGAADLATGLVAYNHLLRGLDAQGLERAVITRVLTHRQADPVDAATLRELSALRDAHFNSFALLSEPDRAQAVRGHLRDATGEEIARTRAEVWAAFSTGRFSGDASHWFDVATRHLNDLAAEAEAQREQLLASVLANRTSAVTALWSTLAVVAVALLIALLLVFRIRGGVLRQVRDLYAAMNQVAAGSLETRVPVGVEDELGQVAHTFNDMAAQLEEARGQDAAQISQLSQLADIETQVREINDCLEAVGNGDLTRRAQVEGHPDLERLATRLNETITSLAELAGDIVLSSATLEAVVPRLESAIAQQAEGAERQAAATAETGVSLEEISVISGQTQERARTLAEAASRTRQEGQRGKQAVADTSEGMHRIRTRVQSIAERVVELDAQGRQIGQITDSVRELAAQLKMLALNASIEAAKSGDAGKGFAVVASEVRELAEQSQTATGQVDSILKRISQATERAVSATHEGVAEVDEGLRLVTDAGEVLSHLIAVIGESADVSAQIGAAVREEGAAIKQITTAIREIDQQNRALVAASDDTRDVVRDIAGNARAMRERVAVYRLNR